MVGYVEPDGPRFMLPNAGYLASKGAANLCGVQGLDATTGRGCAQGQAAPPRDEYWATTDGPRHKLLVGVAVATGWHCVAVP